MPQASKWLAERNKKKSRELDAQVAERVMGWEVHHHPLDDRDFYLPKGKDPEWSDFDYYVDEWQPSTDISAAWAVVEKMREDDFWWSAVFKEVYIDPGLITQAGYEVKFRCARGGTRGEYLGFADELPEAICKAALAVEANK